MPSRSCGVTQVLQPNKNHFACVGQILYDYRCTPQNAHVKARLINQREQIDRDYYTKYISQNITKITKKKLIQRHFHMHACVWKRSTEVKRVIFQLRWTIKVILMQTARACMICGGNRKIRRFLPVSCQSCHLLRHQTYIQQVHLCKVTTQVSAVSDLLPPFQIIGRLTFLTSSLTTRLIQKICANIVKFKSLLKNLY